MDEKSVFSKATIKDNEKAALVSYLCMKGNGRQQCATTTTNTYFEC